MNRILTGVLLMQHKDCSGVWVMLLNLLLSKAHQFPHLSSQDNCQGKIRKSECVLPLGTSCGIRLVQFP